MNGILWNTYHYKPLYAPYGACAAQVQYNLEFYTNNKQNEEFCSYFVLLTFVITIKPRKNSYCARAKRKRHHPIPMVIVALVVCLCHLDIPKSHNLHAAFSILVEDKRIFAGLILRIQSKNESEASVKGELMERRSDFQKAETLRDKNSNN